MLIYNIDSGLIIAKILLGQRYDHFEGDNSYLILDEIPDDWQDYKVVDNKLVKLEDVEINELRIFGEILSEEKRYEINSLKKLTPSREEVEQAERTIDMINLIKEVM